MTESEAIEELKYDCNELGKAIPCDTSWGYSFENAYGMAIKALEKQMLKKLTPIDKEQLKQFYQELEKKSFKVDLGYTETDAVRLVDIEDILINQFK